MNDNLLDDWVHGNGLVVGDEIRFRGSNNNSWVHAKVLHEEFLEEGKDDSIVTVEILLSGISEIRECYSGKDLEVAGYQRKRWVNEYRREVCRAARHFG